MFLKYKANMAILAEWSPTDSTFYDGRYRSHPVLFTFFISPANAANLFMLLILYICLGEYLDLVYKKEFMSWLFYFSDIYSSTK